MQFADIIRLQVALERVGLTVPEPLVRGLHLIEVAQEHTQTPPMSYMELEDQQVRDRINDLALRSHSGELNYISGVRPLGLDAATEAFISDLLLEVREAVAPFADDMVAELRDEFEKRAQPLVFAAQEYGFTYATMSDQVVNMSTDAIAAWRKQPGAWAAVAPIMNFRIMLSEILELSPTNAEFVQLHQDHGVYNVQPFPMNWSICFAEHNNWSYKGGYYLEGRAHGSLDLLGLAAGGLRLNSPAECREKILARRGKKDDPDFIADIADTDEDVRIRRVEV